ncbi:hypothetical protein ElyMa_006280700 [Elysia marginata]|uniref:Uncharacterized protein n=1 Tax=Elysia marginata TaxID=1093978 RepID=A0AAV4HEA0_9GAST|nr:hypothetical protein ElyMa_006280700 [Elysia marginata]
MYGEAILAFTVTSPGWEKNNQRYFRSSSRSRSQTPWTEVYRSFDTSDTLTSRRLGARQALGAIALSINKRQTNKKEISKMGKSQLQLLRNHWA